MAMVGAVKFSTDVCCGRDCAWVTEVAETTIRRDTAPNGAAPSKKANESNDGGETSAPNGALSGTEAAQAVAKAIAQLNKHEKKKEDRLERERALAAVSPRRHAHPCRAPPRPAPRPPPASAPASPPASAPRGPRA